MVYDPPLCPHGKSNNMKVNSQNSIDRIDRHVVILLNNSNFFKKKSVIKTMVVQENRNKTITLCSISFYSPAQTMNEEHQKILVRLQNKIHASEWRTSSKKQFLQNIQRLDNHITDLTRKTKIKDKFASSARNSNSSEDVFSRELLVICIKMTNPLLLKHEF